MRTLVCLSIVSLLMIVFLGCNEQPVVIDPIYQWEKEVAKVDEYLAANNLTAEKSVTGLRMIISELGTGLPAYTSNNVTVNYTGTLFSNGVQFDSGESTAALSTFIRGWQYALTTLPAGSKAKIFIPSYYAYGQSGTKKIPANSTLVFDVHFKSVEPTTVQFEEAIKNQAAVQAYLNANGIVAESDLAGFSYVINQEGVGESPGWYDKVHVKFTVRDMSIDTIVARSFDQKPSENFDGRVIDYIHAMKVMLQKMKPGGKATLYVPSHLAYSGTALYNSSGKQVLRANSNVIVDMELVSIVDE